MARSWGHNAHRFSIEWSRIEPSEGSWDVDALEHYREVIGALRARGLEPVVTLHHFTNPAWFARKGGWLRRDSASLFARYVDHVVRNLGSRSKILAHDQRTHSLCDAGIYQRRMATVP